MTIRDVADRLPDVGILRSRCCAVAILDAILSPDWESRRHSYTVDWGGGASAMEIRDGSGNDCFVVFTPDGAFIKGFDHESPLAPGNASPSQPWPGLVDGVPDVFQEFLTEPAFADLDGDFNATYCLWRRTGDAAWQTGPVSYVGVEGRNDPDGAQQFLPLLTDPTPLSYLDFARSYFEVELDPAAVAHVLDLRPLTDEIVARLNSDVALDDLTAELATAGYPTD